YTTLFRSDIGGTVVLNHTETRPPFFTVLPIGQTVRAANTVTLSAATTGYPPVGYQWRLNGTNIPGANGATLTFNSFTLANQGNYSIIAANSAGTNVFAFSPVYLNTTNRFVNSAPVRNLFS